MPTPPQPPRYAVQILLPQQAVLDAAVVHGQLLAWHDDVQLIASPRSSHFGFAIPTHDLPLLAHVFDAAPSVYASQLDEALQWSPTWRERYTAVARCRPPPSAPPPRRAPPPASARGRCGGARPGATPPPRPRPAAPRSSSA